MALGEYGYVRMTDDINVLVTLQGLDRFHERCTRRGYVATHPGARHSVRDSASGVRIPFLVAGEFPGDGKPKPVAFPDPLAAAEEIDGVKGAVPAAARRGQARLGHERSPAATRSRRCEELIKARRLDAAFAAELDASVRERYLDLERAVATALPGPE